jgi:hypothetical protein
VVVRELGPCGRFVVVPEFREFVVVREVVVVKGAVV